MENLMTIEEFKAMNLGWNNGGEMDESTLRKNYEIAMNAIWDFIGRRESDMVPQVCDHVVASDKFEIFPNAVVDKDLYQRPGRITICGRGGFGVFGSSMPSIQCGGPFFGAPADASEYEYLGMGRTTVWTWGCYGAGANQGIYFWVPVRRWKMRSLNRRIRSYISMPVTKEAKERFGRQSKLQLWGDDFTHIQVEFDSIKACFAWLEQMHIHATREESENGVMYWSLDREVFTRGYVYSAVPTDRPSFYAGKLHRNGNLGDAWGYLTDLGDIALVRTDSGKIDYSDNPEEYKKYRNNPLGV